MGQKFSDNARALLTVSLSAAGNSLTVESGKADRFPVANTTDWLAPANWFKAVLIAPGGAREVVHVGTRSSGSGVLGNLRRGREGTTALALAAGSVVMLVITAADIENALAGVFPSLDVNGPLRQNGAQGRFIPVGGIVMWSGTVATIPAGWQLCDGTNGTPDLRDRFVIGARADSSGQAMTQIAGLPSKTGGSKDALLVSHSHSFNVNTSINGSHVHGVNDPGHAHSYTMKAVTGGSASGGDAQNLGTATYATSANVTGVSIQPGGDHVHNVSGATSSAGTVGTNANLPPFYALAFICCMAQA